MPQNFLDYEKKNNRFLKELRNSKEYRDVRNLIMENKASILCPHDQSVEFHVTTAGSSTPKTPRGSISSSSPVSQPLSQSAPKSQSFRGTLSSLFSFGNSAGSGISLEFVQSHVIYVNPKNPFEFITLNGIRGIFSERYDELRILAGPPSGEQCIKFFSDPFSFFGPDSVFDPETYPDKVVKPLYRVQILRVSEVDLNSKPVRLVLISDPIHYTGCSWSSTNKQATNLLDSSLHRSASMPNFQQDDSSDSSEGSTRSEIVVKKKKSVQQPSPSHPTKPVNARINELINLHNLSISNASLFPESPSEPGAASAAATTTEQPEGDGNTSPREAGDNSKNKKKFSFKEFVEKMKHKSAIFLVKRIKKFIDEINQSEYKQDTPNKVQDFLNQVMQEVRQHPQWRNASELEMDNARESIEKYLMTKIYQKVLSPTLEDLQADEELSRRLSSFKNLKPEHLDIAPAVVQDASFSSAMDELKKINKYKSPRDKMICISNCCKLIFNILQNVNPNDAPSADVFLPILIYTVLKANPPHLHSNIKYIMDFRDPDKMISEAGYFLTNVQSCIYFWQNIDHKSLSIDKSEFDKMHGSQYFADDDDDLVMARPGTAESAEESVFGEGSSSVLEESPSAVNKSPLLEESKPELVMSKTVDVVVHSTTKQNGSAIKEAEPQVSTQASVPTAPAPGSVVVVPVLPIDQHPVQTTHPVPKSDDEQNDTLILNEEPAPLKKKQSIKREATPVTSTPTSTEQRVRELVEKTGPLERLQGFASTHVSELRVGDLEDLLDNYKKLLEFYQKVKTTVEQK